jgi:nucleoside-diphosphate-sugar epimerase
MADLAELIRAELKASPELVITTELPPKMTLIKRPTLERQRLLLGFEPRVGIAEGVRRMCAIHAPRAHTVLGPAAAGKLTDPGDARPTPIGSLE